MIKLITTWLYACICKIIFIIPISLWSRLLKSLLKILSTLSSKQMLNSRLVKARICDKSQNYELGDPRKRHRNLLYFFIFHDFISIHWYYFKNFNCENWLFLKINIKIISNHAAFSFGWILKQVTYKNFPLSISTINSFLGNLKGLEGPTLDDPAILFAFSFEIISNR